MKTSMELNIEKYRGLSKEELELQLGASKRSMESQALGTPQRKHFHYQVKAIEHLLRELQE